jgi:PPOX class probable F420-dependent enzyme
MIPASHLDLLERPLFGHLATLRPDGTPQVNPVWFRWDGELLWFTTTTTRFKYRNLKGNPNAALSVNDPEQPYRYLELRGTVEIMREDSDAEGFLELAHRYDPQFPPPGDAPDRIVVGVRPHHATFQ